MLSKSLLPEGEILSRWLRGITSMVFFFCVLQVSIAAEPEEKGDFFIEENLETGFETELQEEETKPQFITVDVLTPEEVEAAIIFYIRDDINRKFSGLITNLNLEKIYGVTQNNNTATVYFDYSYTSVRNKENVLYEKGKMTFIRFNSGKWFNAELSIYLMDSYPFAVNSDQRFKEE
jgi:hypothetical protein